MKKLLIFILVLTLITASLAGCGGQSGQDGAGVVNVYNWGEYIDDELLSLFEEETGIQVNYRMFETNEQLYSVLKQGGSSFDVIVPSDYMASRLIAEGMLEKLNFDNIPNLSLIDEGFMGMEYDPEGMYTVPYMWGTVGVIYNTTMIDETIDSWGALFDERYAGDILMFDNPRDAMGIALKYLGYSFNTTDTGELEEGYRLLETQKPMLQGYVMDQIFDKLAGGEAAIGPYYAGDYLTMLEDNPHLAFVIPKEGSNRFVDLMCVPKGAENRENAEAFINFMCRTEVSLRNAEYIGYTSPNTQVEELIELDDMARAVMYPDSAQLARCEVFVNLPGEVLALYDDYWVKLKS